MNELALFAGAGGGLLGTRLLGWRTICYVEWNLYCVEVLKARIRDGYLDDAPIWDDVDSFDGRPWVGLVDVVSAGFPCQPFSSAGKGLGEDDPRNKWPATIRIIREVRPLFVLLENVAALLAKPYIRRVFADLAKSGYEFRWDCIPASAIGANHQRDRVWIVAYANCGYRVLPKEPKREKDHQIQPLRDGKAQSLANAQEQFRGGHEQETSQSGRGGEDLAHSNGAGLKANRSSLPSKSQASHTMSRVPSEPISQHDWWNVEPKLGRVADGVANRVERLRALGEGQVPEVVRTAWEELSE